MNIVLMGMKHCGKSTHGKALAAHLGCDFLDTDDLLEGYYRRTTGETLGCREIFRKIGAEGFRRLESEVIDKLLTLSDGDIFRVISLGGGLPVNDELRPRLKSLGCMVFVKVPPEVLYQRVIRRGVPPFLDPEKPHESFMELYRTREKYYTECADLTITLEDCPVSDAQKIIIDNIEEFINEQHPR